MQSAPDAEVGKEDAPVVVCSLQYWSECRGAYQHYATFLLSETNESKVELPSTPSHAVSAVWRVLLAGTRDFNGHSLSGSDSESYDSAVTGKSSFKVKARSQIIFQKFTRGQ